MCLFRGAWCKPSSSRAGLGEPWPFLGAAEDAVSMGSFPRCTPSELEMCCFWV